MKRFLYDIFIILAVILVFNTILFLFAENYYYSSYEKYPDKKFNSFILSDSHGERMGKYPAKHSVFNFSAGGDSYCDMKRKLVFLLENGYNVDKIYITVDDHTLSPYKEKTNNLDRSVIYTSANAYTNYYKYLKEKYIKYYLPIFQPKVFSLFKSYSKAKLKNICHTHKRLSTKKTWRELSEQERINRVKHRMKKQFSTNVKSTSLQNTLLEIISLCQKNEIELIGIKFPLSNSYIELLDSMSYGADQLFISKDLKVIDLKEVFVDNPEYFANQDHINSKGSKIFTEILFKK